MRSLSFAFALLTVASAAASAQIGLVHVTSCGPQNFPAAACAIPPTGAGNLLVVGFQSGGGAWIGATVTSITDNAGNTYSEAGGALAIDTAAGAIADIWFARNSVAGATALTLTPSAPVTNGGVVIWEFSGADPSSPFDRSAVLDSQPPSATPSGAGVAATPAEVVVSLATVAGSITGITSGNTFIDDSALKGDGWTHFVTTAAGTFAPQWNQSSAGTYASSTASFRPARFLNACDLNGDGAVNVIDVQLATNMYLGLRPCTANIAGVGVCSTLVVRQVINAALTGTCTTARIHSATLNWTASTTPNVNYNVYRSTTSGGPYTKLTSSPVSGVTWLDGSALAGQTYYYVTTAVDSNNNESSNSNEASAAVPFP